MISIVTGSSSSFIIKNEVGRNVIKLNFIALLVIKTISYTVKALTLTADVNFVDKIAFDMLHTCKLT